MQFSTTTILLATLTLSTQVPAAPTPYIKKVDTPSGRPKYVCVDSDLSCLTKRAYNAVSSAPGFGGLIGHVIKFNIRKATIEDVENITQIELATNPQLPSFHYVYPYADKYPEDTYKWTRESSQKFIENTFVDWDYLTLVAETKIEGQEGLTTVAFTSYEVSAIGKKKNPQSFEDGQIVLKEEETVQDDNGPHKGPARRDINPVHAELYSKLINNARREFLEPTDVRNGPLSYIHVTCMATHPDYQRNGAATALLKRGLALAQEHHLQMGLFASPMGRPIYEHFKFKDLAFVKVQVEGEEESCTMVTMKWFPED
ncbi:hypothetical protein DL98DRAFT_659661 [Cadophora sp. DSE1049]|nr:hypothetical protein DL98DRAFT_659661 [Cadophora sp. DSE1049]